MNLILRFKTKKISFQFFIIKKAPEEFLSEPLLLLSFNYRCHPEDVQNNLSLFVNILYCSR